MRGIALLCLGVALYSQTLQQTIQTALRQSPTLQAKKLAIKLQEHQKAAHKAKMYGEVDLNGAFTHYNIPRTLKPLVPPITPGITVSKDISTLGVSYKVALFKGFADLAQVEVSKLATKKSQIDYKLTKEELIYNIKALYFKGLGLLKTKQALLAHKKALQALYESTKKEVELGSKAPLDLLKIKSRQLQIESQIISTQNAIKALKAHISALIGDSFDGFESTQEEPHNTSATPYLIKKLQIQTAQAKKELKKAKALYYPKVFFSADYVKNWGQDESAEVWQTSIALGYSLFDFGYKSHTYQKGKIASLIAQKNLATQKLALQAKLQEAMLQKASLESTLTSLKANLKLLQKIESIEKLKYESGRSEIDDYLLAIAQTKEAQSKLARTRYELYTKIAYINYLKAGE